MTFVVVECHVFEDDFAFGDNEGFGMRNIDDIMGILDDRQSLLANSKFFEK